MKFENLSVIGLGYIGLPTAAMFASCGVNVVGVDLSPKAVETINRGEIHIVEPGLSDLVRDSVQQGKLKATYRPEPADAFIIAVPTPIRISNQNSPEPDLSFIKDACEAIAPVLQKENLIVLESTSPVGTTEKMCSWLAELRPDLTFPASSDSDPDIFVAYCPERVLPGKVIQELVSNDRIIGGITPKCSKIAKGLYNNFVKGDCYITNSRTAEMAKLTENASRDVQIAFANELSMICDEHSIDVWELIKLANRHPRVDILRPGAGVGGHCIAIDPYFIISKSPDRANLIKKAREVNSNKPSWVKNKILSEINASRPETVIICGVSFKPDIDDIRESPSLQIAKDLSEVLDEKLIVWEPNLEPQILSPNLTIEKNVSVNIQNALYVFLVKHSEFSKIKDVPRQYMDFVGLFEDQKD